MVCKVYVVGRIQLLFGWRWVSVCSRLVDSCLGGLSQAFHPFLALKTASDSLIRYKIKPSATPFSLTEPTQNPPNPTQKPPFEKNFTAKIDGMKLHFTPKTEKKCFFKMTALIESSHRGALGEWPRSLRQMTAVICTVHRGDFGSF